MSHVSDRSQIIITVGIAFAVGLIALSPEAQSKTIRVPGDVPTIQAGLDSAGAADTVLVDPDTYYENLIWPDTPEIKLYANEPVPPDSTIIDGGWGMFAPAIRVETPVDLTTEIKGFIIRNGGGESGGGILCSGSSPTIAWNHFANNAADSSGGGICVQSSSALILNNTFKGNSAEYGGAIASIGRSAATIQSNDIDSCNASQGGGIYSSDNGRMIDNTVTHCTGAGAGMYLIGVAVARANLIQGNRGRGIHCAGDVRIVGNEISNNDGGISIGAGSTALVDSNTITNNITLGDGGGILSVNAYPTICWNKITHNWAVGPMGLGGGLHIGGGHAIVSHNKIIFNHTDYEGAGIFCSGDSTEFLFNNISYNVGTAPEWPGCGIFT